MTAVQLAALARLYTPSAESLRRSLPDIGDGLQAQFLELHKRPCADAAERLAINLDASRREVMKLRERLIAEGVAA